MIFWRKEKDVDQIVDALSGLRNDGSEESVFLDNEEISNEAIVAFIDQCGLSRDEFKAAERILKFATVYNALAVFLRLKNRALESEILEQMRNPDCLLRRHKTGKKVLHTDRDFVEQGFGLFIDHLPLSEGFVTIGLHEILASRFMNFLSRGRYAKEDNKRAWLTFSLILYHELRRLPEAVASAKRRLRLR